MPPEHHDRPQCGSGNQTENDAASIQSSLQPQQQPQQPQQITSNGAGRLFYLKPALRNCFACVGATNRQYLWREVLTLLRDYIRCKNIIDKNDNHKIDCKNDPLSSVLGIDSFQYGEQVKKLFSEQVTVAVINDNTVPILTEPPLATRPSTSSSPGCTRALKEYYASINWNKCFPEVPAPKPDDIESIYSYQGYETVSCHNTEYEESEAEEVSSYEEYELASDDAQEANVPSEDNETDIEVLNIDFYEYRDDSESDWADEDSNTSDEDPDLACFSWACITCGIKNQPFVNYCEHCWKVRKDILPDRPRRNKRRKPRNKKRQRKSSEKPEEYLNKQHDISENICGSEFFPPANFDRSVSLDSTNISPCSMSKSKSQDSVATIDIKSRTIDYTSSQDSGIGSQDFLTEESLTEFRMSDIKEITEDTTCIKKNESLIETPSKPSCSKEEDEVNIIFEKKGKSLKKRRRSSSEESETTKRIKTEDESEKKEVKDWGKLLQTESFKEWFLSEEGHKFLYSKSELQDGLLLHSCSGESSKPATGLSTLCSICLHRPKNVHPRVDRHLPVEMEPSIKLVVTIICAVAATAVAAHGVEDGPVWQGTIQRKSDATKGFLYKDDVRKNMGWREVLGAEVSEEELGGPVEDVVCPGGGYICPGAATCCPNRAGSWSCCPHPWATCCGDGINCCPHGYWCVGGTCQLRRPAT